MDRRARQSPELTEHKDLDHPQPPSLGDIGARSALLYELFGIWLPFSVWLWLLFGTLSAPTWKSGTFRASAMMLMQPLSMIPFWPLLGLASWAVSRTLSAPLAYGRTPSVRLGLIVGVVIGAQYTVLLCSIGRYVVSGAIAAAGAFLIFCDSTDRGVGSHHAQRYRTGRAGAGSHEGRARIAVGCSLALLILPGIILAAIVRTDASALPVAVLGVLPLAFSLFAWPVGLLLVCGLILRRGRRTDVLRLPRKPRPIPTGHVTGIAAIYVGAWAWAVACAIADYNSLPSERPDSCYVASAASGGHRRFVRSKWVRTAAGVPFPINEQLRTLKAGELALRALLPRTHRVCRRIYDYAGPPLAALLRNPWLADAAYTALIPLECLTRAAFRLLGLTPTVGRWQRLP